MDNVGIRQMKHLFIALGFVSFFACTAHSEDLSKYGLQSLENLSEKEGNQVRGAGRIASRTTGSAGLTATVLDPDTGSIWNFNVTQFNQTSDDKDNVYGNQYSSALTSTFSDLMIGFGDVGITLGDFQFQMNGAAARAAARTSAGSLAQQIFQQ
jgi:hypothetical protein